MLHGELSYQIGCKMTPMNYPKMKDEKFPFIVKTPQRGVFVIAFLQYKR
jgi:hypothetical protein